jgi:hypothetical protein
MVPAGTGAGMATVAVSAGAAGRMAQLAASLGFARRSARGLRVAPLVFRLPMARGPSALGRAGKPPRLTVIHLASEAELR